MGVKSMSNPWCDIEPEVAEIHSEIKNNRCLCCTLGIKNPPFLQVIKYIFTLLYLTLLYFTYKSQYEIVLLS